MTPILYREEVYTIVGFCLEVRKVLGFGFSETIYKDAMEQEFIDNQLLYTREHGLCVYYKGKMLKHRFNADFTVLGNIIIEVKSGEDGVIEKAVAQTLNYLRASGLRVGLIINFGKIKLEYKRLIV